MTCHLSTSGRKLREEFSLAKNSFMVMCNAAYTKDKTFKVKKVQWLDWTLSCELKTLFEVWISKIVVDLVHFLRHLTSKTLCEVNNDEHHQKPSQMCSVHCV